MGLTRSTLQLLCNSSPNRGAIFKRDSSVASLHQNDRYCEAIFTQTTTPTVLVPRPGG